MDLKNTEKVFQCFAGKKLLIIGDVMIDSYMVGKVDRISPEAPIPIVSIKGRENRLGGASNVARNVKSLGAVPIMCSVIGEDKNGTEFKSLLKNAGMATEGIISSKNRRTTVKTRVISNSQHLLRVDEEDTSALDNETEKKFTLHIKSIIDNLKPDAIIFEDYDKGVITPELISNVVQLAREKKIPVTADPKKQNFHNYKGITLFKPNYKEMQEGMKTEFSKDNLAAIKGISQRFLKETETDILLLTLADAGAVISDTQSTKHIPAEVRNISDVSGAGDTVIATATLCLCCDIKLHDIAYIANMAGGLVCEYSGVVPIDKEELIKELKDNYSSYITLE